MGFAELLCRTNYSFLRGASRPAELMEQARVLGIHALGIVDMNGVYGVPKAYRAAEEQPAAERVKLLTGAELSFAEGAKGATGARAPLALLVRDRKAYGLLCRLITAAHAGKPKGEASLGWEEFLGLIDSSEEASRGLIAFPRIALGASETALASLADLRERFSGRLFLPLSRLLDGLDARRTAEALSLGRSFELPIVATNDVHYHLPDRRKLHDIVTAIREGVTLSKAGHRVFSNSERHLKGFAEMAELFKDMPDAVARTLEIAESCTFSPSELRYRYPSEWIPVGETSESYLRRLTWEGARTRYKGEIPADVSRQLEHELSLISKLAFADYFLTIWEIVEFARGRRILCQGRGSAANSAVCYCLGITAVDPVRMNLLFERFISAERGEPPDIDIDFENGRREEVIQHIYEKYGRHRAAMVAAVITYRSRMAKREIGKVIEGSKVPAGEAEALAEELHGFPRHLSIHSGGFTLSADPIIETVPVEPARMEGRTIVQWDKDDLDFIGLIKVDVLALGMLSAMRKTLDLVGLELHEVPAEDPATYEMIQRADTVGTFQIESRAQMSMLPRLLPKTFYDLVIQVAIVRPGPIVGNMVHPYLRRRRGQERADVPHPKLEPILRKTLGVPLFQEQVMQMAIQLAGFTPGEADELRRAIAAWRSSGSIERMGKKLMEGFRASGLPEEFIQRIFSQIQGFAEYGFPESHAASFALIAYASSWLKCHHPAEFTASLINSQPMGFYHSHSLVDDAKRHGVRVLAVHPNLSEWDCVVTSGGAHRAEAGAAGGAGASSGEKGIIQLGWSVVHGLGEEQGRAIVAERAKGAFTSLADFLARTRLKRNVLHSLAMGDAFSCFGLSSRDALWEVLQQDLVRSSESEAQLNLFSAADSGADHGSNHGARDGGRSGLFAELSGYSQVQADYSSYGLSVKGHPMQFIRQSGRGPGRARIPQTTTAQARAFQNGRFAVVAGLVIVRQRPPTAKETTFATLEDEQGFLDLILHKDVFERFEEIFLTESFIVAKGIIQREGHAVSMIVKGIAPLWDAGGDEKLRVARGKYFG